MKNTFMLAFLLLVLSCNNDYDKIYNKDCEQLRKEYCRDFSLEAKNEISKGNIYYCLRVDPIADYEIYKKFGLISCISNFDVAADSCFQIIMRKKIENDYFPIDSLKIIIDNLERKEDEISDSLVSIGFNKGIYYLDGTYSPSINEINSLYDEIKIQNNLIKKITKIDTSFYRSSFYLTIDTIGNIENVEIYVKSSKKVDSLIVAELKKIKLKPFINEEGKKMKYRFNDFIIYRDNPVFYKGPS
jgi:hypothetical protein